MAQVRQVLARLAKRSLVPPCVTLAYWRLGQSWRWLVVTGLGIMAAIVIACTVPLLSQVALTAGVRAVLTASPQDPEIELQAGAKALSNQIAADGLKQLRSFTQANLGPYLSNYSQFVLQTSSINLATPGLQNDTMFLTGVSIDQASSHLRLLQGRLPRSSGPDLEVVLTQRSATSLQVSPGSIIPLQFPFYAEQTPVEHPQHYIALQLPLHVVGVIALDGSDPFWHAQDFEPARAGFASSYRAIMSSAAFLATVTQLAQAHGGTMAEFDAPPTMLLYFFLDASRVTISNLDNLIARLNSAQIHLGGDAIQTPALQHPQLIGPTMNIYGAHGSLERFRDRIPVILIPLFILAIQVLGLILFFVNMMVSISVDRQAEVTALIRSRGASRRQVFSAFALQMLTLLLLALAAGPAFALLIVRLLVSRMFSSSDQSALQSVSTDPLQAALGLRWYVTAVVVAAMIIIALSIWGSTRQTLLGFRQETARSKHRPLWQRLRLDMVAASIAFGGYSASFIITRSGALDARASQVIFLPVSLVTPIFLLIAAVLLFARLFPWLLRFFAWQTTRRRAAPPALALAQMSRAPHQSIRMLLALALSVSFAIFTLVYSASEAQQMNNVAAQQVGADFSGPIPIPFGSHPEANVVENTYRAIPGVTSATIGNATDGTVQESGQATSLQIRAVDTNTFAQTAIWTDQDSSQPLPTLLARIAVSEQGTGDTLVVPALVDAVAWNALQLTPGARFTLNITGSPVSMTFQAITEVQHIPTINDSLQTAGGQDYLTPGGILVDLHLYTQTFEQLSQRDNQSDSAHLPPSINYIWLRTSDTTSALAAVREALTHSPLSLEMVYDRRAMLAQMQRDPLFLALRGVLILGAGATLLLAFVVSLLFSSFYARRHLFSFAVLRALGSTPRQIASMLSWEQGIVYTVALALGAVCGVLLVVTVIPALVFTNPTMPGAAISSTEYYVIQHVLPVQIVLPLTLGLVMVVFAIIALLTVMLTTRMATKPSLIRTLRLNED
ncbi:MAG TPA: FtsX-like permease family protein [Ktedonobacterales bacterium]|jgi:ABC-type lipoprotein release transport system permease subunit